MDTNPNTDNAKPYDWRLQRWRLATIVSLIALALIAASMLSMMAQFEAQIAHLQAKVKLMPQIKYVSVLLDSKQQPALLASFALQDNYLQIQRLNEVQEGREDSMQLWALDDQGRPLSLGLLPVKLKTAQLAVTEKILSQTSALAISVEDKGGALPNQPPRLPFLFQGQLVQKAL